MYNWGVNKVRRINTVAGPAIQERAVGCTNCVSCADQDEWHGGTCVNRLSPNYGRPCKRLSPCDFFDEKRAREIAPSAEELYRDRATANRVAPIPA